LETGRTDVSDAPMTTAVTPERGAVDLGRRTRPRVGKTVDVGALVRVRAPWGEDEYLIASPQSADPGRGRISMLSPVGAALLGRRPGEQVRVQTPGGVQCLTILDVVPRPAAVLSADPERLSP
jgi:Transcription elongation factor, GreA/GreB, C-term